MHTHTMRVCIYIRVRMPVRCTDVDVRVHECASVPLGMHACICACAHLRTRPYDVQDVRVHVHVRVQCGAYVRVRRRCQSAHLEQPTSGINESQRPETERGAAKGQTRRGRTRGERVHRMESSAAGRRMRDVSVVGSTESGGVRRACCAGRGAGVHDAVDHGEAQGWGGVGDEVRFGGRPDSR